MATPGRSPGTIAHVALEVGTGAERSSLSRQHNDADGGVLGRFLEQVSQVVEAISGDGVESFRRVNVTRSTARSWATNSAPLVLMPVPPWSQHLSQRLNGDGPATAR